jgi:glycosyltransferase involved in cell wall biosynthesis
MSGTIKYYLFINQFYPPDNAPTGRKLHDVALELVRLGHKVDVICSCQPYGGGDALPFEMDIDGVHVLRIGCSFHNPHSTLGKLYNYIGFYLRLAFRLVFLRRKPDLILTLTTPPYLGLLARFAAFIHRTERTEWVMDLYPDVMVSHGMLREGRPLHWMLCQLAKLDMRGSKFVLTLSPEMAQRAKRYAPNVKWLPLWGDDSLHPMDMDNEQAAALRAERGWAFDDLVLLYSGNMGRGHSLNEFLEAATHTGPNVRWVFCGIGPRRREVERFMVEHPSAKIELLPLVPHEQLNVHLCSADVHLASVRPEWNGTLTPSKAVNSFAVGRPIIFVGNQSSSLAGWIKECGAGWVVENGNVDALLRAVEEAKKKLPSEQLATQIRAFHDSKLSARINLMNFLYLLGAYEARQ